MVVEIRITPRRIERFVFVLLVLGLGASTVYYSFQVEDLKNQVTGAAVAVPDDEPVPIPEPAPVVEVPEPVPEPIPEPVPIPEPEPEPLSGVFEVQVSPIRYTVSDAGDFGLKAKIDHVSLVVANGLDREVAPVIKVYAYDRDSAESQKYYAKYEFTHPLIQSGKSLARSYPVENVNLYKFELPKTLRFEFYDEEDFKIAEVTKIVRLEE